MGLAGNWRRLGAARGLVKDEEVPPAAAFLSLVRGRRGAPLFFDWRPRGQTQRKSKRVGNPNSPWLAWYQCSRNRAWWSHLFSHLRRSHSLSAVVAWDPDRPQARQGRFAHSWSIGVRPRPSIAVHTAFDDYSEEAVHQKNNGHAHYQLEIRTTNEYRKQKQPDDDGDGNRYLQVLGVQCLRADVRKPMDKIRLESEKLLTFAASSTLPDLQVPDWQKPPNPESEQHVMNLHPHRTVV